MVWLFKSANLRKQCRGNADNRQQRDRRYLHDACQPPGSSRERSGTARNHGFSGENQVGIRAAALSLPSQSNYLPSLYFRMARTWLLSLTFQTCPQYEGLQ